MESASLSQAPRSQGTKAKIFLPNSSHSDNISIPEVHLLPVFHLHRAGRPFPALQNRKRREAIMAKKKKLTKNDAQNELKTLESKWLKDHRLDELQPIQTKVMAAKVAAVVEFVELNHMPVSFTDWPLQGAEELVKLDQSVFKQGLDSLLKIGVLNSSFKFRKAAGQSERKELNLQSENGQLHYRCVKPGGVNISDRDEYLLEDQEITFTEESISESQGLQTAIANEWLIRIEEKTDIEDINQ